MTEPSDEDTADAGEGFTAEDWRDVRRAEATAAAKAARLPRCRVCREPLWLGQDSAHFVCLERGDAGGPPGALGRPPVRLLVCGARDWPHRLVLEDTLDSQTVPIQALAHGGAAGADRMAGEWAVRRGIEVHEYPADWDQHGRAAGPRRNRLMLAEFAPGRVIAFKDNFGAGRGGGTEDMVAIARAAGVSVWLCDSHGQLRRPPPAPRSTRPAARQHAVTTVARTRRAAFGAIEADPTRPPPTPQSAAPAPALLPFDPEPPTPGR
jgi:hypothetical protein